jgi:hypothetical protein
VSEFRTALSALTASDSAPAWVINNIQIDKTLKIFFCVLHFITICFLPPPHPSRRMYINLFYGFELLI